VFHSQFAQRNDVQIVEAIGLACLRFTRSVLGIDDECFRIANSGLAATVLPEGHEQVVLGGAASEGGLRSCHSHREASEGKNKSSKLHVGRLEDCNLFVV